MNEHFDTLETRDPELRERAIFDALRRQIAYAKAHTDAFARILADVDPAAITTRAALAYVPITRKSDLLEVQRAKRPFGGFAALRSQGHTSMPKRVFASRGPGEILKCRLKPVTVSDYTVAFTPAELVRLDMIFPQGVCDWSKAGVAQQPPEDTWLRYLSVPGTWRSMGDSGFGHD